MKARVFVYYRAGIAIAKFEISSNGVMCLPRDMCTLEYGEKTDFVFPMQPFSSELDKRLTDAVQAVRSNTVLDGCEYAGEHDGVKRFVQQYGKNPLDILTVNDEIIATIDNERNYLGILVKEGMEELTPLTALMNEPTLSRPEHGLWYVGCEMVPMRDGVKLATDIYLPADYIPGQKLPTVLIRTCYNKTNVEQYLCFVHYGYAIVSQDTRGRELSEGEWRPIINEKEDGDDTLNWIADQPWSDGSVGMIGTSYLAIVQWQAAASGNKHLKALISMVTGGVPLFDFPHRAGALSPGTMAWCSAVSKRVFSPELMERDDWNDVLAIRPIKDIPSKGLGYDIPFFNEWIDHEYYDGYWHKANFLAAQHKIDVPALYVTGWYDDVGPGSMQVWNMNKRNSRANQKLVCGAWLHKMNVARDIHNIYYGADAIRYDMFYKYLRWYDHFLKGIDNGVENDPVAQYFVIGNGWRESSQWPPAEISHQRLYLTSGGDANTSEGNGRLTFKQVTVENQDKFVYDPADPAPFLIDVSENECLVPANYRDVELRQDVLVYTSAPLEEPLTIAGEPVAVLYAASSAKDTDWVVRLTDVDDEGNSIRLCDGIVRAKFRKSFIEPTLLLPGEIVRYEIPLTWIANEFKAGHRVRVEVTSGAANSVFPNTNTGLPSGIDACSVIAKQTVYSGGLYDSHLVMPVLNKIASIPNIAGGPYGKQCIDS